MVERMLENVFTKGTQGVSVCGDQQQSSVPFPANRDWQRIVTITAYNSLTGVVQGESIFDKASTKTTFYAQAYYSDSISDIPDWNDVQVGALAFFSRVGRFNTNPGAAAEGFEQGSEAEAGQVSFACLVSRTYSTSGVPAFCEAAELSMDDLVGTLRCSKRIVDPQVTSLERVISYEVASLGGNPLRIGGTESGKKIIAAADFSFSVDRAGIIDCLGSPDTSVYNLSLLPGEIHVDGEEPEECWVVSGQGDLSPGTICCTGGSGTGSGSGSGPGSGSGCPVDFADMETYEDDYATITWLRGFFVSLFPDGLQGPLALDFTWMETRQGTFGTGATIDVLPINKEYVIKFMNVEVQHEDLSTEFKTLYALKGFRKTTAQIAWNSPSNNTSDLFQFYIDEDCVKCTIFGTIPLDFSGEWSLTDAQTIAENMHCYLLQENGTKSIFVDVAEQYNAHSVSLNKVTAQIFNVTDRKKSPVLDVFIGSSNNEETAAYGVTNNSSTSLLRCTHPLEKLGLMACVGNFLAGSRVIHNWQGEDRVSFHMPGERKNGFYKELDLAESSIKVYSYNDVSFAALPELDDFSDFTLIKERDITEVVAPTTTEESPIAKADNCFYASYFGQNSGGVENINGIGLSVFAFTREKFKPTLSVDRVHLLRNRQIIGAAATHPDRFESFRAHLPVPPVANSVGYLFTPSGETDPFYRIQLRGMDVNTAANFTINIYEDLPLAGTPYVAQFVGKAASSTTLANGEIQFNIGFKLPGTGIDLSALFSPSIPTATLLSSGNLIVEVVQDSPFRVSQGFSAAPLIALFPKGSGVFVSSTVTEFIIDGSISRTDLFEKAMGFYHASSRFFVKGNAFVAGVNEGVVISSPGNGTYSAGFEANGGRVTFTRDSSDYQFFDTGLPAPTAFELRITSFGDITGAVTRERAQALANLNIS